MTLWNLMTFTSCRKWMNLRLGEFVAALLYENPTKSGKFETRMKLDVKMGGGTT